MHPRLPSLQHSLVSVFFFFFNDTATTEIYTLSLHDALPIFGKHGTPGYFDRATHWQYRGRRDRKSTRLNSSHVEISYAVFCLKKKNKRANSREHRRTATSARARIPSSPRGDAR